MHNHFCDGTGALEDYASQAEKLGVCSLGFSSHAPVPFPCKWAMDEADVPAYLAAAELARAMHPALQVYKGMEVDYVPGEVGPSAFSPRVDYTIGSIHFVGQLPDGRRWEIDGPHEHFLEGLSSVFSGSIEDAVNRYFELTGEMLQKSPPDILGHFDKIKIQNPGEKFFKERDGWYHAAILKTLDVIESSGVIVEVNTRGQYLKRSVTTYPSPWILEIMRERNIPITISSDAHKPGDIVRLFPECAAMLGAIGFKNVSVLLDGSWQPVKFTPHGISL